MNFHQIRFIFIMQLMILMFASAAQKTSSARGGSFEMGGGLHFLGPSAAIRQLLIDHRYNATTEAWFFGGSTAHPIVQKSGITFSLSYVHRINKKGALGLSYGFAGFGEAMGACVENNELYYLSFDLNSHHVVLFYNYEILKNVSIKAGPALVMNSCKKTNDFDATEEQNLNYAPGILTGIRWRFYNSKIVYVGLQSDCLLMSKTQLGPFTSTGYSTVKRFPESRIGLSYMNAEIMLGVNVISHTKPLSKNN